jgi:multidrug efflux system outer membrane protein
MKQSIAVICLSLGLAACAVGPNYQQPEINLEQRFIAGNAEQANEVAKLRWWNDYQDPLLTELVSEGLSQNLDVIAATERIRQALANLRTKGVNASLGGDLSGSITRSGGDNITTDTTRSMQLGASFVIDLFGGVRRDRESAVASLVAAQADVETTRLAWLAEVISAYSNARYYQTAMVLANDTIATREETVEITQHRFDLGDITEYELAEAQALLASAQATLPEYLARYNASVFTLSTLMNQPSSIMMQRIDAEASQLPIPMAPMTGLPTDLLRNRPDIRSAEASLEAAVANVGVAQADLYPSLTLSGSLARTNGADGWSFGPSILMPLFNQGALRATKDSKVSLAKQAEIDWRAQVLAAVEDVHVAQSNLEQYQLRADALMKAASFYERALELAKRNYRAGAITLLDLLDTDRSTASARVSAASAVNDAAQAWASLQLAIGAGAAATNEN